MEGKGEDKGVSPRAVQELFLRVESTKMDWQYTLTFSMLEIYNESILDLLDNSPAKVRNDEWRYTVYMSICLYNCLSVYVTDYECSAITVIISINNRSHFCNSHYSQSFLFLSSPLCLSLLINLPFINLPQYLFVYRKNWTSDMA